MTTYDRRDVFTPSSLLMFRECPLQFYLRYVADVPTVPTPEQRRGTAVHAAIAAATLDPECWQRAKVEAVVSCPESDAPDLGELFDAIERRYGSPPWFAPLAIARALVETSFTFNEEGQQWSGFFPDLPHITAAGQPIFGMTPDFVDIHADGSVLIRDYKTNRSMEYGELIERDFQLRCYAWGLCQHLGGFDRVVNLEKDYVRHEYGLLHAECDGKQFEGVWSEIAPTMAAIAEAENGGQGRFPATPNEHCGWCGVRGSCPEWGQSTALALADSSAVITADNAAQVALMVRTVAARVDELNHQLRDYVRQNGPIVANGATLDFVERPQTEVSVPALVAALRGAGIPNETILGLLQTSKDAVETWRTSYLSARKPEGKALRDAIKTAYNKVPRTEFRWTKGPAVSREEGR